MTRSVKLTDLDRALVSVLQVDPRATWTQVGAVLKISPSSAARRWERLVQAGSAWLTPNPGLHFGTAHCFALVAVRCEPGRKADVAAALARDPHAVSVEITAGSSDLSLTVAAADLNGFSRYLLGRVDRLEGVITTESFLVSQMFREGSQWRVGMLDAEQRATLHDAHSPQTSSHQRPLVEYEQELFLALCQDGRTGFERLATQVGTSPATVRRRVRELFSGPGVVALRCDVAAADFGWPVTASLRAQVPPRQLQQAGHALAQVPQVRMCAAVTGAHNLVITAWLRSVSEVQRLESEIAERLPYVVLTDRSITLKMIKRMGRLLDEDGHATGVVPMAVWSDPLLAEYQ